MYQYPYGDSQQLNLDWLVSQWQIVKNGIDQSLQAEIDRVEDAIADLLNARDQAVAAAASANNDAGDAHTDATNAHTDALAAAGDAASASADALKAEGNAVGEQNGTPVASGSPYYQNNAKYYATQAGNSASAASTSETNAHNSELAAAGDAASASADALKAEGNAVGEQNGTPVASGSPYYQNNAEYYATQAAQSATDAQNVLNSIPADYTQLSADVAALQSAITDYNKWTGYLTGTRVAISAGNNFATSKATDLELIMVIPPNSSTGNNNIAVETSAFTSNGSIKYEVMQPIVSLVSFKNNGLIVKVSFKLLGKYIFIQYVIQDTTNRANQIVVNTFSGFNDDVKSIRGCTVWQYANNANEAATIYWKTNTGNYSTVAQV